MKKYGLSNIIILGSGCFLIMPCRLFFFTEKLFAFIYIVTETLLSMFQGVFHRF